MKRNRTQHRGLSRVRQRRIQRVTGAVLTVLSLPLLTNTGPALAVATARHVAAREQARRHAVFIARNPVLALNRDILPKLDTLANTGPEAGPTSSQHRELRNIRTDLRTARAALAQKLSSPRTPAARIAARRILARLDAEIARTRRFSVVAPPPVASSVFSFPSSPFSPRAMLSTQWSKRRYAALSDALLPDLDTAAPPPLSGAPTAADLAVSAPQTSSSAAVQVLAAELKTPVKIFEHFRNRFVYEPYFGAVKGANRTLIEQAGNDTDIASAMISVLRAADVPCRYVYGTIRLSRGQAASWLGVAPETVPDLLAAAGIPFETATDAPDSDLLLDHVWVAAWIDYLPYRGSTAPANSATGTPGAQGDFWIELDPSFKQHVFTPTRGVRNLEADLGLDAAAFLANIRAGALRGILPETAGLANGSAALSDDKVANLPGSFVLNRVADAAQRTYDRMTRDRLTLATVFRSRVIADESYGLLPCTDLYRVEARGGAWPVFPEALTARVHLAASDRFGRELLTWDAPQADILGHRLSLAWTAATDADRAEIETWRDAGAQGPFPAWRVRVLPRLLLDAQPVARGTQPVKLGADVHLNWQFLGAGSDPTAFPNPDARGVHRATDLLCAGALAAFVFDAGRVTDADIEAADAALANTNAGLDLFLDAVGRACFYQADRFASISGGLLNLFALRRPSLIRVSTGFQVRMLYDLPFTVEPGPVDLRIVRSAFTVSPLSLPDTGVFHPGPEGGPAANRALATAVFPVLDALVGSALAANTLGQMTGASAVSPLQLLDIAGTGSTPVLALAPTPGSDGFLPAAPLDETVLDGLDLDLDAQGRMAVLGALNQGATVVFPRTSVASVGRRFEAVVAVHPADGATDLTLIDADSGAVRIAGATTAPVPSPSSVPDLLDPAAVPDTPADSATAARTWLASIRDATFSTGVSYVPALATIKNFLAIPDRETKPGAPVRPAVSALKLTAAAIALWGRIDTVSKQPAVVNVLAEPPAFSPNNDGAKDRFTLDADVLRADDWTLRITDARNRELRTFAPSDNLGADAGKAGVVHIEWDGRNAAGARVPDGRCQWTLTARGPGGTAAATGGAVVLDATPPTAKLGLEHYTRHGTTVFTLRGTADDATLDTWTLELRDAATDATVQALDPADLLPVRGNLPVVDARFLTLDENRLPNGTYYARLTVADKAGNSSSARTAGSFSVNHPVPDVTPPEITVSGPSADPDVGVLRGQVPVTVRATDAGGIASIELRIDGADVATVADSATLEYTLDCTTLTDAVHILEASATDPAGNAGTDKTTFLSSRIVPDVTPPTLAVDAPDFAAAANPAHLVVHAADNHDLARIELLVDHASTASNTFVPNTAGGTLETDIDPALVTGGTHRVEVRAEDRTGNRTTVPLAVNRNDTPDAVPPAVALTTSADSATGSVTGPIQVHATATDASGVRRLALLLDGAEIAAVTVPPAPAVLDTVLTPEVLGDGAHTILARAEDVAGNSADSAPRQVVTDNLVRRFTVTPERLTPGLPTGATLTVDALLRNAVDWRLRFRGPQTIPDIAGHSATIHRSIDLAPYRDGHYTVELDVHGLDNAPAVPFTKDLVTGPPVAEFANLDPPARLDDGSQPPVPIRDGLFDLKGTADDPDADDAVSWKIELRKLDGALVRNITPNAGADGWNHSRVTGDAFGTLDFTLIENGVYDLLLTVRGGADSATASVPVALDSQLKVGAFRFSQQDLTVPLPGLSVVVARSYDSIAAKAGDPGDFGPGWTMALSDVRLELDEQRAPTRDTDGNPFSKRSGGGRDVTLTLPDGRRTTFYYTLEPAGWFTYRGAWKAAPGVHATLKSTGSAKLIALPGLDPYWEAAGPETPMDNFEFPGFVLTTRDGTRYVIDREDTGAFFEDAWTADTPFIQTWGKAHLRRVEARTGARIEFRADGSGIDHYNAAGEKAAAVVFQRDNAGRITAAYTRSALDADGNPTGPPTVRYSYDGQGNLVKVERIVDRADPAAPVYRTIEYLYENADFPHYITRIKDPRGLAALRTEVDSDGRLAALVDADGNRIELDHNLADRVETVTDRLGAPTTYVYDTRGNVIMTVDAQGNRTSRTYDADNNETSVTDPNGNTTSYTYDGAGNRTSVTDPLGNTTYYTYDSYGNQLTVTDPLGNTTTNTYDADGNLTSTTNALGQTTTQSYGADGNLTATYDAAGNVTASFGYDSDGNMTSITDPNGVTRSFAYDADGNQTGVSWQWVNPDDPTDVRDVITQTIYNAAGQVTETIDPRNNHTYTSYNAIGKPETTTDKLGNQTVTTYDARGNVIQTVYPDGTLTRTVYDKNGRAVVTVDRHAPGVAANGARTIYNSIGRVVRTERLENVVIDIVEAGTPACPSSVFVSAASVISSTSTVYDPAGRVLESTNADGQTTRYEYDKAGRQTAVIDALGNRTEYEYDNAGRQVLVRDALGRETSFVYDALGRRVRTIFADGTSVQTTYDTLGRRIAETDQTGVTKNFEYDTQGRLVAVLLPSVEDPENADTPTRPRYEYEYDMYGRLSTIRDPKGRETTFTYDEFGRRLTRTLPLGQTEHQSYNTLGQLGYKIDFKGQATEFLYDTLGRTIAKRLYSDCGGPIVGPGSGNFRIDFPNAAATPDESVAWTYDALGRQARVTEHRLAVPPSGGPGTPVTRVTDYSYDANGRLVQVASPEGTVHYEYDPATGRKTHTYTANNDTEYGYDELGRIETVTVRKLNGTSLTEPDVTTYDYTAVGSRAATLLPNGVLTTYEYDNLNRLTNLTHFNSANEILASYDYTLAPTGRRTGVTETRREADDSLSTVSISYTYDQLNRLTQEASQSADLAEANFTTDYTYDLVGNRLQKDTTANANGSPESIAYTFDANDRMLTETSDVDGLTTYGYSDNGEQISKVNAQTGETVAYTYNLEGRLSTANIARTENGQPVEIHSNYVYNHSGIRVRANSIVTDPNTQQQLFDKSRTFLVDSRNHTGYAQVLEEHDGVSPTPRVSYVLGDDVLGQTTDTGGTNWFAYDGHGSTRLLTDGSGAITDRLSYDAYGVMLGGQPNVTSPVGTDLTYSGEQFDAELGMGYNRSRYYAMTAGVWNRVDPFVGNHSDPQSLHKYAYCHGQPVDGTDPSGSMILDFVVTNAMTLSFRAIEIGVKALPAIKLATVWAATAVIAGYTAMLCEEAGFIPDTPIPEIAFMGGMIVFSIGVALISFLSMFEESMAQVTGPGRIRSAKAVNEELEPRGYTDPSFRKGTFAAEGKANPDAEYVRVYDGVNSQQRGAFIAPKGEVIGKTPAEVQSRLALPSTPNQVTDVAPKDVTIISGTAGANYGQSGGGTQVFLKDLGAAFSNPRPVDPSTGVFK